MGYAPWEARWVNLARFQGPKTERAGDGWLGSAGWQFVRGPNSGARATCLKSTSIELTDIVLRVRNASLDGDRLLQLTNN
jgi:hypothetical protein